MATNTTADKAEATTVELFTGEHVPAEVRTRKIRGKSDTYKAVILNLGVDNVINTLKRLLDGAGENLLETAIIRDIIVPACYDCADESFTTDPTTGEEVINTEGFVKAFIASFIPTSRGGRGGIKISELYKRSHEIGSELNVLVQKQTTVGSLDEADTNRLQHLLLDFQEIHAAIEKKTSGSTGRPKGSKNKAKEEVTTVDSLTSTLRGGNGEDPIVGPLLSS